MDQFQLAKFAKAYDRYEFGDRKITINLTDDEYDSIMKEINDSDNVITKYVPNDHEELEYVFNIKDYNKIIRKVKVGNDSYFAGTEGVAQSEYKESFSFDNFEIDEEEYFVFAIYDGHGSHIAKTIGSIGDALMVRIREAIMLDPYIDDINSIFDKAFTELNNELRTDEDFTQYGFDDNGLSACVCIINNSKIYCANIGNTNALYLNSRHIIPLTKVHSMTDNESELARVIANNHLVYKDDYGIIRNYGTGVRTTLTRGFGDFNVKHMISTPEIMIVQVVESKMNYLILTTDGVSDVLNYDDIYKIVSDNNDSELIAKNIIEESLKKGSRDNISCIVVDIVKELPQYVILPKDNIEKFEETKNRMIIFAGNQLTK